MFPLFEGQNSDQSESELQNIFIPFASEVSTPWNETIISFHLGQRQLDSFEIWITVMNAL